MTPAPPRLLALATAVPPFRLAQAEIQNRARGFFEGANALDIDHLLPVFANAGIDARYSCVPLEWYDRSHGWAERNSLYLSNALALLEKASRQALAQAGIAPDEIDGVVVVSTTGIATPSLDAMLM
ncbi:MAG TPA: type III polyketide synthase, partial [Stellaceae bacterium]|nr:type III polyketide synthase [Stellaceae bacterium]